MRMEKADILENVVKYMQGQQLQQQAGGTGAACASKPTCDAQYRLGYLHCVREVTGVLEHLCGANSQITQSLTHYLNIKVTQLTNQYLSQAGRHTPTIPTVSTKSESFPHTSRVQPECTSATSVIPPDAVTIRLDIFEPSPVIPRVPAMMPAAAQAIAIGITAFAPSVIAYADFATISSDKRLVHTIWQPSSTRMEIKDALNGE